MLFAGGVLINCIMWLVTMLNGLQSNTLSPMISFPTSPGPARYRLKYCLKGRLNPKQPTNPTSPVYKGLIIVLWLTGFLFYSISTERHRAEVRRAVNDEKLATIADK